MARITEDYISFETAKLLIKKGFDYNSEYDSYYTFGGIIVYFADRPQDLNIAPRVTLQMAMKWLREVYGLYIWVDYSRLDCNEKQPYLWNIVETKIDGNYWGGTYHKSHEEAVEAALKYSLKNLI